MAQWDKVLRRVLGGHSDANIPFADLCGVWERLGYPLDRIEGSHRIFVHHGQPEFINVQPAKDGEAKAYQVKRIRQILTGYGQTTIP